MKSKKSFRLFFGTMILAVALAATSIGHAELRSVVGGDPVPLCPPGGCVIG